MDTSAWVEFLRGTRSQADELIHSLLGQPAALATTDVVLMEILAGARDDGHRGRLRGLLARCEFLPTEGPGDYERAADLYRACRRQGESVRGLTDCLVAAVAIRAGVSVLHQDADFEVIARHSALAIE